MGRVEDFHLQAVDHARHTIKSPAEAGPVIECVSERDGAGGASRWTVSGPSRSTVHLEILSASRNQTFTCCHRLPAYLNSSSVGFSRPK